MPKVRPPRLLAALVLGLVAGTALGAVPPVPQGLDAAPAGSGAPCAASDALPPLLAQAGLVPFAEDPEAAAWAPFLVGRGDVAVPPPPAVLSATTLGELTELHAYALNRTQEDLQEALLWDAGPAPSPWSDYFTQLVQEHNVRGVRHALNATARDAALLHTAMHDALVLAWAAKACYQRPPPWTLDPLLTHTAAGAKRPVPSYPSEHAVVAGVAQVMFQAFFPCPDRTTGDCEELPEAFDAAAARAAEARLVLGLNYRSDTDAGLALGRAVAERALAARADDGFLLPWDGQRSLAPCTWQPMPPPAAQSPRWMNLAKVRPWLLPSTDAFRPPPPPPCGSDLDRALQREVYDASRNLTDAQRQQAMDWNFGPGTATFAGAAVDQARRELQAADATTMAAARAYGHVSVAVADAVLASWDAKAAYWSERPSTGVRREVDPAWTPYLLTPPHPQDASEHGAVFTAAFATLGHFVPERAEALAGLAEAASRAPFYGGLADKAAIADGVALGLRVAERVLARADASG